MKKQKMLAILGSPHQDGFCAAMLQSAIDAAKNAGCEVCEYHLYDKNLAPCKGCSVCMRTGQCILQDDLQEISALLQTCDIVVLAAPTYWANVPAPVKNLFDRLRSTVMKESRTFPKPLLASDQKYLLLTSCNTQFPFSVICRQSSGSLHSMKEFFQTSGMKHIGSFTCAGIKNKKTVPAHILRKIQRCLKARFAF